MTTAYTTLLGLALPVQGELQGTWGDEVNNYITNYLDAAVAGTQTISGSQTAVTLSKTTGTSLGQAGSGATGSSQYFVINCTGNPAGTLTITAPAASKAYLIINATSTSQDVKIVGAGPTTGVTLVSGERAIVSWNGSDFVKVANFGGVGSFTTISATTGNITTVNATTVDTTNIEVTNVKAKDGTASASIADATGIVSFSANPVLSGGTANGVLYLDGSKVATSGSALTFDGTNFAAPNLITLEDTSGLVTIGRFSSGYAWSLIRPSTNSTGFEFRTFSGNQLYSITQSSTNHIWYTGAAGGSEQMRLTSTGLGIGTSSPAAKLDVVGDGQFLRTVGYGGSANSFLALGGTDNGYVNNGTASAWRQYVAGNEYGQSLRFDAFLRATGWTTRATLDSAGNLGLEVTPSAWGTNASGAATKGFSVRSANVLSSGGYDAGFGLNVYRKNNGGYYYQGDGGNNAALLYLQDGAGHKWLTAPSGVADTAISFTQSMTLDASGNLIVGGTSAFLSAANRGNISINGSNSSILAMGVGGASATYLYCSANDADLWNPLNGFIRFGTNNTERARITSGGDLLAGVTSGTRHWLSKNNAADYAVTLNNTNANPLGAQIYHNTDSNGAGNQFLDCFGAANIRAQIRSNGGIANYQSNNVNLSDRREKTNFAPAKSYLDAICAIPVQTFNYVDQNLEDDPGLTLGVVAQDVQAVAPELVMESNWGTKDDPKMRLSIYQTDLQYALMKCIQEQQALITDLRARVAALEAQP